MVLIEQGEVSVSPDCQYSVFSDFLFQVYFDKETRMPEHQNLRAPFPVQSIPVLGSFYLLNALVKWYPPYFVAVSEKLLRSIAKYVVICFI